MGYFLGSVTQANISVALAAINFVAFAMFGIDKAKAQAGARRASEANLLVFAMLGGTPGAYTGRALFRHKTRKQPFSARLHAIAALQTVLIVGWVVWRLSR